MSIEKIRIGLDHDDILEKFIPGIVMWSHHEHGTSPRVADYDDRWERWWELPLEAAIERRDEFWLSGVAAKFAAMPGARESLQRLVDYGLFGCEVEPFIVTSRPRIAADLTKYTVSERFPGIFKEENIVFAGYFDSGITDASYSLSKGKLFKALEVHIAADDLPLNVNGAGEEGIPVPIHMDRYNRHRGAQLHPAVRTASDWRGTMAHMLQSQSILQPAA